MTRGSVGCGADDKQPHELPVTAGRPTAPRRLDLRRFVVAAIFVPLIYALIRYFPPVVFFVLVTTTALLALVEFYRLYFRDRPATLIITLTLGAGFTTLLLISLQWPELLSERTVLLLTVGAALASRLLLTRELSHSLVDSAVLVSGVLYIGLMLGHLLLMRALPEGVFLIFFVVLVTWAGDTGAYFIGTTLGYRRLAPVISPNKTIEGLVGGVAFAVSAALIARYWFLPSFSVADCLATGILLALAGALGDLAESALKRSAGVKDSGALLPSHGGMLDRLDSMLFTAPAFYYYVTLIKG